MASQYVDLPVTGGGGVSSLNALTGALNIVAGSGITVTPAGQNITLTATGSGGGSVTNVSVVSANGFNGSVANPATTPAITLSTTITGILQGNGTAISAATTGNLTEATSSVLTITGGTTAVLGSGTSIQVKQASTSVSGYLSNTDWNTFNGKQAAGNYITALTGDITASGPGSAAATLATVNSNVGSFGSSTAIPSFTVNGKGLITAASTNVVIAPAGTLTGTTLASNVVTSSLTTVGTIGTGVWQGTVVGTTYGGTGSSSANVMIAAFGITIDGGGSAITTGVKGYIYIPFGCTINSVTMLADQSGSIVVDVWKVAYASFPPTISNTITASAIPTISSAQKSQDTTLTGWTTSVSAGDTIGFNVNSATTITRLNMILKVTKT